MSEEWVGEYKDSVKLKYDLKGGIIEDLIREQKDKMYANAAQRQPSLQRTLHNK